MPAPVIDGYVQPGLEPVYETFKNLWEDIEVGASLAVYRNGELVIDLWGGFTDRGCSHPWHPDTLVNVYSTSKGITAIALACLVEDGLLDYHAPMTEYWPEFGAEQKFDITVADALSHRTGLYTFQPAIETKALYDWQVATFNIASQSPAWPPRDGFGYHAITWGFIAGEIVRRIKGETLGAYIRERITGPLKADVHLGLEDSEISRCSDLIGPNHARKILTKRERGDSTSDRLRSNDPILTPFKDVCSTEWRKAEIPASNIHATAKGVATCFNAFLNNGLTSKSVVASATRELTRGETDMTLGRKIRRSRGGFILNCGDCYCGPNAGAYGHSGTGGSVGFADPANNIAFTYVMNQLDSDGPRRYSNLVNSLYQAIENETQT